jgi:hypothetical protein
MPHEKPSSTSHPFITTHPAEQRISGRGDNAYREAAILVNFRAQQGRRMILCILPTVAAFEFPIPAVVTELVTVAALRPPSDWPLGLGTRSG